MTQKTFKQHKIWMTILGVITIALVFVSVGTSLAAKLTATKVAYSDVSYTTSTGVELDNSTTDYPIEYQVGSVARNISVSSYSTRAQYVKATITLRYVSLNAQTGACTVSNLSTNNVNLVPFVGSDWYLDETLDANGQVTARTMYLCRSLTATTSGSTIVADRSTMLTGVEFFDIGGSYSGYQLQIIVSLTTSTSSSFAGAPAIYTRRIAGSGSGSIYNTNTSISAYGSCTTYNMRAKYNKISYGIGSFRTPIYVKNDSNATVALSFRINVTWVDSTGSVLNDLHINRVKLNFANNTTMIGYNATNNNTSPKYKITGASTTSDQLQYLNGTYFYMTKVAPYQTLSLIDSVEVINYAWASVPEEEYEGSYLVVTVSDVKTVLGSATNAAATTALGTVPSSWPTDTASAVSTYHAVEFGHTNLIQVSNSSTQTFTAPSTFISLANNETVQISYQFYLVGWLQYRSTASVEDDEYDLVGGEYRVIPWSGPSIQVNSNWYAPSHYRLGSSSNAATLAKDRAVQLYSTITIPSSTTIRSTWESGIDRDNYTDQFGNTGNVVVSSSNYTPTFFLLIVPTYTITTSGSYTATDYGSEVLLEKTSVTLNSAGTRSFAFAIKNTSAYAYTSASVTLSFTGTISNYALAPNWSRSGTTFTYSGASDPILPGQTRLIVGGISGSASASITGISGVCTLSTTTAVTNAITVLNETLGKGVYYNANSATSVNYSGNAVSNTKKLTVINTSTSCQLVRLNITYNYMKAGTTISTSTSVTDSNWSLNSTYQYYIGILAPGDSISFGGGYTPATTTALQGSSMSLSATPSNSAITPSSAVGTSFSAPSGWSNSSWVTSMTTLWNNIFKYSYSA